MKFIGGDGMPIQVLLVEDSPGDVRLSREAFRTANPTIHSKPVQLDAFENLVKSINDFWLTKAKLPEEM